MADPIKVMERAHQAKLLLDNPLLNEVITNMREDAIAYISSGIGTATDREKHCATLSVVTSVLSNIQSIIDEEKFTFRRHAGT